MNGRDNPRGTHQIVTPTVVNIAEVRETLKASTLLHFTESQWKHIFKDLEKADKFDEKQAALEVVHLPGRRGEMLAALAAVGPCPLGCDPVYIYEEGKGELGQTTIDQILIGCDCAHLPPPPPPPAPCHPAFVRTSGAPGTVHARAYQLICVDNTTRQPCRDYVIAWWQNPQGGGYCYCKHR